MRARAGEEAQGDDGAKQMSLRWEKPATACDRDRPRKEKGRVSILTQEACTSGVPWKWQERRFRVRYCEPFKAKPWLHTTHLPAYSEAHTDWSLSVSLRKVMSQSCGYESW